MTAKEFLIAELKEISLKFPQLNIKYAFNERVEMHVVELLPLDEYDNNSALDDAWIPVSIKFLELFKDEHVTFISSDSRLAILEPEFELLPSVCIDKQTISSIYEPLLTNTDINYTFSTDIFDGTILSNNAFVGFKTQKMQPLTCAEIETLPYLLAA